MKKLNKIHWMIIGSMIFLCIPIFSSPDFRYADNLFGIPMFLRMFTSYLGVLIFFFINYFYLIPKFYFRKKYLLFAGSIIFIFLIVHNVPTLIFENEKEIHERPIPKDGNIKPHFRGQPDARHAPFLPENIFFQFFLIVFISLLLRVNARLKEAENERLRTEVAYLKAQINPHFLFNTLNSLYALTIVKSNDAPDAVVKLSDLMRYIINESSKDFVELCKELEYVKNFVGLQKLRLTENTDLKFEIKNDDNNSLVIAPLLMISFIENAFKYGVDPDNESLIAISIIVEKKVLNLKVTNTMVMNTYESEKNGIGIHNSKKRLELIYPQSHNLRITEDQKYFEVKLTIELHA